jgi:nitrite reductase (NADH) small subunit
MAEADSGGWVSFGPVEDIPRGGARAVKTLIGEIGLFRTTDDRVFALDNLCPHKGARLSLGTIEGDLVTCPFHGWQYRLDTGRGVDPGFGMTCTAPVRVVDGIVQVRMNPSPW